MFRYQTPFLPNEAPVLHFCLGAPAPPNINVVSLGPLALNDFSSFQNKIKHSPSLKNVPSPGVTAFSSIMCLLLFKTNRSDKTSVGATPGQKELEYLIKKS